MRKFLNALTSFFNNTVLITPNKLEKINLRVQKKKKKFSVSLIINYLLMKRIIIECNFHRVYKLIAVGISFNLWGFLDTVVKTSLEIYKIFVEKRKIYTSKNEMFIFESIQNWLRKIFYVSPESDFFRYFSIQNLTLSVPNFGFGFFQFKFLFSFLSRTVLEKEGEKKKLKLFFFSEEFLYEILNLSKSYTKTACSKIWRNTET